MSYVVQDVFAMPSSMCWYAVGADDGLLLAYPLDNCKEGLDSLMDLFERAGPLKRRPILGLSELFEQLTTNDPCKLTWL